MSLKNYEGAVSDCEKGLEFEQDNKILMQNRALSQLYGKKYKEAETSLDELIKRYPNYVYSYMMRGQLDIEKGDTLAAVEDYSRAIAVDRHFAPARAGRAYVFLIQEDYANALPDLDEAVRLDPDVPGYYINRGLARYNLNNLRGTLDDFDRVIRLDPNNDLAWYNRGLIRSQVGDINRAIEDFDKVIYLDPNHHVAIYNRALLRSETGDYTGAIDDLNTLIAEYPKFTPALYQRSEIKRKAGDAKGADRDYFAAWNLDDKLKAERDDRKKNPDKYAAADSILNAEREKKRNLDRYNKIILAENDDASVSQYQNPMRGRVQDQNVEVEMEKLFTLTFYEKSRPGPSKRPMDFSKHLTNLTVSGLKEYQKLLITNQEEALSNEQANYHFRSIDELSSKIVQIGGASSDAASAGSSSTDAAITGSGSAAATGEGTTASTASVSAAATGEGTTATAGTVVAANPVSAGLYFARGLDFALVQDLTSALDDLDKAIDADPSFVLAYFERANLRYRKINVEYAESQNESESGQISDYNRESAVLTNSTYSPKSSTKTNPLNRNEDHSSSGISFGENAFGMDYELVMRDYERILDLDPTFIFAWFNRGNIRCLQRDYRNALIDFTKAIELNPDFADAWFNRGITQIYLGDRAHGLADLRMAGQLGLYKAYNLIKRFEN
jgi:tetratricopeptide (TPR) repeat protein